MMRNSDNHLQASLVRGIVSHLGLSAENREETILIVESMHSTDWASVTFVGARHRLALRLQGPTAATLDAAAALDGLAGHEFQIAGHIVAEIVATRGNTTTMNNDIVAISLTVKVLTIQD